LRQKANITTGIEFATLEDFERYLEQRRQTLLNERVLADVKAEYTLEKGDEGRIFIDITFITKILGISSRCRTSNTIRTRA